MTHDLIETAMLFAVLADTRRLLNQPYLAFDAFAVIIGCTGVYRIVMGLP
jgi:hypothetical protein